MIFDVRCQRVNLIQAVNTRTGEVMEPHPTKVFLDQDDTVGTLDYQVIEGTFQPMPFAVGKRYRITVEEVPE